MPVKGIQLIIYLKNILTAQKDCALCIHLCIIISERADENENIKAPVRFIRRLKDLRFWAIKVQYLKSFV